MTNFTNLTKEQKEKIFTDLNDIELLGDRNIFSIPKDIELSEENPYPQPQIKGSITIEEAISVSGEYKLDWSNFRHYTVGFLKGTIEYYSTNTPDEVKAVVKFKNLG